MSTRMIVDKNEGLKESGDIQPLPQPAPVKTVANIVSYLFHPVFVPVYLVFFLVYIHPYVCAGFDTLTKSRTMIMSVMMYSFFPIVTVLLLKALNFIESFQIKTQRDRVIPLVTCMIWYGWIAYVWFKLPDYPLEIIQMAGGIFVCSILGLFGNIIMKVSLHAISMGLALAFILLLAFNQGINFGIYISVVIIAAGLVCTSRFIISDHSPQEIYGGLIIGALSMVMGQALINFLY